MKYRIILPILIALMAAVGAVTLVKSRPAPERQRPTVPPPLVRVESVRAQSVRLDVSSHGKVRPRTETVLVAEVGGRIEEVSDGLSSGAFFTKGDVLARIDPRDYRVGVARAEAGLAQAEVALAREEGEARVARADWEALEQGSADPLVLREPQLAGARANLTSARASLDKAKLDLARTEIRAPYDGRVRARTADVGQFVAPGTPLAQVYATDAAEIRLGLPASRVGDVDLGAVSRLESAPEVTLRADFGGRVARWKGRLVRAEGEIDPVTRMLHAVARVEDPFARQGDGGVPLPAGLFVEAEIEGRRLDNAFVLPREALREGSEVLVAKEGRLHRRAVEVARVLGDDVIVTDGLTDGELVCISNLRVATDGMAVRVEQAEVAR